MADLEKRPHGIRDSLIASAIFWVIQVGGPIVSAWFITRLALLQALPAYQIGLIAVGGFFVVALAIHLLVKLFTEWKAPQTEPPHSFWVFQQPQPHIEVNPTFNVSPTFTQTNTQQQSQQQSQRQVQSESTPEIEMRKFVEKVIVVNDIHIRALAIPFRNNSDGAAINVIAQISFENANTHDSQDVNYGFWIEPDGKLAVLGIGTTNHLALVGLETHQAMTLDSKSTRRYVGAYCQTRALENGIWRVRINLVGDSFRQSYPPFGIEVSDNGVHRLRESTEVWPDAKEPGQIIRAKVIRALSDFAEEGRLLLNRGTGMESDWPKANDWASRAEAYIREIIDEESAAWFCLATTEAWPGLAVDRRYVDWIHTRIYRLGELASEVRRR